MSETNKQKVNRRAMEVIASIFEGIVRDDGYVVVPSEMDRLKRSLTDAGSRIPDGEASAALAALSDEDFERGFRDFMEPTIRGALASLRPS